MSRCFFASGSGATSAPGRYAMDFDQSADTALQRISDAAGASLVPSGGWWELKLA
jgi:hypothetical protein